MILWLVGLSGSGKTTIGREIYALWKPLAPNTVLVDGDEMRRIMGRDTSPENYTLAGRREITMRYSELCAWLDRQGINAVCSVICNFEDLLEENRTRFSRYFQVYLDAPIELVRRRDPKGLYARADLGMEKNVVGVDIPFTPPSSSDFVVEMSEESEAPRILARRILRAAGVLAEEPGVCGDLRTERTEKGESA